MTSRRLGVIRSSSQGEIGRFNESLMPIESITPVFKRPEVRLTAAPEMIKKEESFLLSKPTKQPEAVAEVRLTADLSSSSSKPMQQPEAVVVPRKIKEQPKKGIFTVEDSVDHREKKSNNVNEEFGVFLQACSMCKKKLQPDKDVYMYGFLGAFCSADCRDDRIALDGLGSDKEDLRIPINMTASKRFCITQNFGR